MWRFDDCHPALTAYLARRLNIALTVLVAFAIVLIELIVGGTRLVFSLPSYAILALAALLSLGAKLQKEAIPRMSCLVVTAVFFTYILARASLSPIDYIWWEDFYMVLACLIVYYVTALYFTRQRPRTIVIVSLLCLAVIEVLIGLRQFTGGDNWMPFGFLRADSGRRASGTLISSIHLAGYLEVVGVLALSFAFWSRWKVWARVVSGYIALACYVGVAITGSRGGYLSTVAALGAFAILSLYSVRAVRPESFRLALGVAAALFVIGMGGAILLMSQHPMLQGRLRSIPGQLEPHGLDIRIANWQAALDHAKVSPWFGTGAGTHLVYGRLFRRPKLQYSDPIHAHNDYLELLAEYGIAGAIGMAAFLIAHLRSGFGNVGSVLRLELRQLHPAEPAKSDALAMQIGALSAIAAIGVHSISDFNLHIPGHALIFAFLFGVIATPAVAAPAASRLRAVMFFRLALPALGIWMAVAGLPKFPGEYWCERARVALRDAVLPPLSPAEFAHAIECAHRGLRAQERNPYIYFYLGGAHRGASIVEPDAASKKQHLETAMWAYLAALEIFPQDIHMLIRLADTLDDLGRFKEAEEVYRQALAADPNFGRLHAYYAKHLAIVGRQEEAEERFETARKLAAGDDLSGIVRGTSLDPENSSE